MAGRSTVVLLAAWCLLAPRPGLADPALSSADSLAAWLEQARGFYAARSWAQLDSVAAPLLERLERMPSPDSSALARVNFYRGLSRGGRFMYGDSMGPVYLERSLRIYARMARPDTARWVNAVDVAARFLTEVDLADSAIAVTARGRALCRPPVTDADSMLAALWITEGYAQRRADRFALALAAYDSALALRERRYGREHPAVAEALSEIGAVYGRSDRLEEATRTLEESIGIYERTLGPWHTRLVPPVSELANVQLHVGDIARSIETLERTIEIITRNSGPGSIRLIVPSYNIGLRLYDFGDYAGARAIFASVLPRAEAYFGAGNARTETYRFRAAASSIMMGDTAGVAEQLARTRAALLGKPIDTDHIANQIERYWSKLLVKRGDLDGAQRALAEGLARERATARPIDDVLIQLLDSQATVQMARRDSAGLDSTLNEMAARYGDRSKVESVAHPIYLRVRARAEHWRGRLDEASTYAKRGEELERERLLRNVRALPDQRALQMAGDLSDPLDLLVALSGTGRPEAIETAWDRLVRWRGLVTAEFARRHAPHAAASDTALAGAHARWVAAVRRAARMEVTDAKGPQLGAARAEAEAAERRYAALAAVRGVARDTATVSLASIRAALTSEQALVSIVTVAPRSDTARVVAFVTRGPGAPLERVDLGPARELSSRIAAWRSTLATPPRGRGRGQEQECRRLGAQVRTRTWDRLEPHWGDATTVVLVADGELADLTWQALPLEKGRYLVEGGAEILTPAAERELLAAPARDGRGLLALGDPDFGHADDTEAGTNAILAAATPAAAQPGADSGTLAIVEQLRGLGEDCTRAPTVDLEPLPGARAEVSDIARAWDDQRPAEPATLLVGAAGSEAAFKTRAPGRAVVHLATHGILWGDRCAPVYAGMRGVGGTDPLPAPAPSGTKSPPAATVPAPAVPPAKPDPSPWGGRRMWLALAGANHARSGGEDENEGLLTADEVTTLDLSDVDWVVLSACQSGVGRQWPLEGSVGMRRAFRLAGARAVIASQWSIADEATRDWMKALYRARTSEAVAAGRAMREASRSVLRNRRREGHDTHPFYWAAFTVTGR